MKSTITARVEFSFKGETYDLSLQIDLDALLSKHPSLPPLHDLLAREHHIDRISYLYEVMQEAEIEFSNAQGMAADFLRDGHFDQLAFASHREEHKITLLLQPIAQRELNIDDLTQHQAINKALIQAYKMGKGL